MKIAIIPDVHGRSFWREIIPEVNNFDKIIFLGDYLDPYLYEFADEKDNVLKDVIQNFKDIIEFKQKNIDIVELLIGNHDVHYCSLAPDICRMDMRNYKEIFSLYNDNRNLFKLTYKIDNLLFTHAGISKAWLNIHKIDENKDTIIDYLNNIWNSVEFKLPEIHWMQISNCTYTPISDIGRSRGGDAPYGSCIWADATELQWNPAFEEELIQIVGHTQLNDTGNIIHFKNVYCCDSRAIFTWIDNNLVLWKSFSE